MIQVFKKWLNDYFADEEAISLLLILVCALLLVIYAGHMLTPVIIAIIIAYLLQGVVQQLTRWLPETVAVSLTFVFFCGLFLLALFLALPIIGKQLTNLVAELPKLVRQLQALLLELQGRYPHLLSQQQTDELVALAAREARNIGQLLLDFSLASIPNIFAVLVYMVLTPILVFFLLKDRRQILGWLAAFLPERRPLMRAVWGEMNTQVANYARGKAVEIVIVGGVSYVTFTLFGLQYAALLALLVGLSVLIPYIGAAAVTLPIAVIGYLQWGPSQIFVYLLVAYGVIQFLDGNVLVPLLFSEVVNLHPVAIIVAVLFFGGIWGLWGVFFAIPLATLVKALLQAWPKGLQQVELREEGLCE